MDPVFLGSRIAKAYENMRIYIGKLVLIGHSHVNIWIHEDFEELFLGYRCFLEFFKGSRDVAKILRVLGIDVMVDEKGDKGGFLD